MTAYKRFFKQEKGFTLIELLVVIAIIGVLAAVVLVAINPVQQLARARDSGRKQTVGTLGNALEAYATSHEGSYVTEDTTWITSLVTAGEVSVAPAAVAYSAGTPNACAGTVQNSWCYDYDTTNDYVIVWARMESTSENAACSGATPEANFVWSSANGGAGIVCIAADGEPAAGVQTFQ